MPRKNHAPIRQSEIELIFRLSEQLDENAYALGRRIHAGAQVEEGKYTALIRWAPEKPQNTDHMSILGLNLSRKSIGRPKRKFHLQSA
jgi:hypothetical protein